MDGFGRSSSRRGVALTSLATAAAALGGACVVDELPPLTDTTSLRVELVSPEPGSADDRLPAAEREVVVRVEAIDARGLVDVAFEGTVDLYAHYLGTLTPPLREPPLGSVELVRGDSGEVTLNLPPVYSDTFIWAENVRGDDATFATGTSEPLYFREPSIIDVRRPEDENALDALESSPLDKKQVEISGSRHGESGRLVVTSVSAQGYTVQDVACEDARGTPPCTSGPYDSVFVFTFSRPTDHRGRSLRVGDSISSIHGGITIFNGLTQFAYPQTLLTDEPRDPARLAPPVVLDPSSLATPIEIDRLESSLLAVEDAQVCPLDQDYESYAQWKLDVGRGCRDAINVITEGRVEGFDPADHVGRELPRVVGVLLPVNIGSFHVWIIYPRGGDDLALPET